MVELSLCLIVRDEEEMLPGCLASVRGVVDEIVAVDTGSRDGTRALLAAAGARIVDLAWRDDFSAARNAAVEAARGRYVLVLDADERLAGAAPAVLRAALRSANPTLDCGLLPLHHASRLEATPEEVLAGQARLMEPLLLARLLRRTADLLWRGTVHENVEAWLARPGRVVRALEAPIVHYGAVPEWRAARQKRQRNLRLLEARCAREPHDPVPRTYLANELLRAGETTRARTLLEEALALLEGARRNGAATDPTALLTLRATAALKAGETRLAEETLALGHALGCEHVNLDFLAAALREHASQQGPAELRRARAREAAALYQRCLARAGEPVTAEVLPGATGYAAATALGHLCLRLGELVEAEAAFEQALASAPAHAPARLGLLEARIERGEAAAALQALEPLLANGAPDAWFLAALACERLGQHADAALFATTSAREGAKHGFAAAHRAAALTDWLRARAA